MKKTPAPKPQTVAKSIAACRAALLGIVKAKISDPRYYAAVENIVQQKLAELDQQKLAELEMSLEQEVR